MSAFLQVALTNAVLALGLAVIAWASSFLRRPAITHALWLLVLLRLVMPPMWQLPIGPRAFADMESDSRQSPSVSPNLEPGPVVADDSFLPLAPSPLIVVQAEPAHETAKPRRAAEPWPWVEIAGGVWITGAVVCLAVAMWRVVQFRRVLRHVAPAPATWQTTCDRLAERYGLRRGPMVGLVPGPLSPLLWAGFGRPQLILPEKLLDGLGTVERAAIMAHELAHLRRYDHWVRRLELVVTALYWWFPLVWLARRELRAAGEQCCDLWVVWALPKARRAYATALVDTVDFLSGASRGAYATPVAPLPPLASGVGEVRYLRRRISMIMRSSSVPRRLTRAGLIAGLGAGVMTLMLTPGRADDDPPRPPQPPPPPQERRERQKDQEPQRGRTERGERARDNEIEKARNEIRELQDTMRKAQQALQRAEQRLAELEGRPMGGGFGRGGFGGGPGFGGGGGFGGGAFGGSAPPRGEGVLPGRGPGGFPPGPGGPGGAGVRGGGMPGGVPGGPEPGPFGGTDQRMQALERQLESLRRELDSLRRELRRPEGGGDARPRGRGEGGDAAAPRPRGRGAPPGADAADPPAVPRVPRQPDVPRTPPPPAPPRPPEPPPSDNA